MPAVELATLMEPVPREQPQLCVRAQLVAAPWTPCSSQQLAARISQCPLDSPALVVASKVPLPAIDHIDDIRLHCPPSSQLQPQSC